MNKTNNKEKSILRKKIVFEVGFVRIVVIIIQLLFVKIITNKVPVGELGIYYFLSTLSYALNAIVLVPMDYFQQSKLYEFKENKISLKSYIPINLFVVKYLLLFIFIIDVILLIVCPKYSVICTVVLLMSLGTYLTTFLRGIVNNLENRRTTIYNILLESTFKILFFLLFVKFFQPTSILILFALLFASFISLLPLIFYIKRLPEYKEKNVIKINIKSILKFSYPISVSSIINLIQMQGYRILLVPLGLSSMVGIYGTVANVGSSGLSVFSTIYNQLFVPDIYKTKGHFLSKYIKWSLLIIVGVLVFGFVFSTLIISILTSSIFVQYSKLISFGILTEAGNFLIGPLTIYMTLNDMTKLIPRISLVGLFCFVISFASLFYLKLFSLYTIGLPMVLTQIVIFSYQGIIVYKHYRNQQWK